MTHGKVSRKSKPAPITLQAAEEKIRDLRQRLIPASCEPENLDLPVDAGFRVTSTASRHLFELIQNDTPISWCTIIDFEQQIGAGVLRMGGIAGVRTHDDHRFQGHSRRVMVNSLRWMRQAGFDVAMLYGITGFYPKFGYAKAFPAITFTLAVRDAELVEGNGFQIIDYTPAHLLPVLRMYHKNNSERTGITRRDPKLWAPFRKGLGFGSKSIVKVVMDQRQRPQGYFVCHEAPLTANFIETGFASPSVFPDMLRAMARHAWERRLETIRFTLPEDDAFIEYCRPLGLQQEKSWKKDGGPMVRMINIPQALGRLSGGLAARMHQPARINIRTNLDNVSLEWKNGKMKVAPAQPSGPKAQMPQWALAQLLYGYRPATTLASEGIVKANPQAIALLQQLFPVRPHFHYAVDQF